MSHGTHSGPFINESLDGWVECCIFMGGVLGLGLQFVARYTVILTAHRAEEIAWRRGKRWSVRSCHMKKDRCLPEHVSEPCPLGIWESIQGRQDFLLRQWQSVGRGTVNGVITVGAFTDTVRWGCTPIVTALPLLRNCFLSFWVLESLRCAARKVIPQKCAAHRWESWISGFRALLFRGSQSCEGVRRRWGTGGLFPRQRSPVGVVSGPHCLDLNPSSATCLLCGSGKVI